ncbi:hypothetical protein QYE76_024132 [Lolium multiflorum]|uniref:Reverse transcriptase domain-containing protein n=1 Tax=Lolium multiflorum TaxID=4521 RepID=A0AAD8RBV0_LOLMU|nr:hypothetical protein QYE76_024132 [Lolium multiflorum]
MDALHLSIKENSLYWRTRAKIRYALEGDENTKFFHASATCRLRRNSIPLLSSDGVDITDHRGKASILQSYYTALLGSVTPTTWRFDISMLYPTNGVLPEGLTTPFTPEEVKGAFFTMNKQSSPGPDGFGPAFFNTFWPTVSQDVLEVFSSFFDGSIDLTRINRAFLVLLPKIDAAVHPSQFRPISLQNCIMKAITKVLTIRLQAAIHSLVDADQTGFLSGRRISENIVYAADLLRCCHSRKAPTLVFKIDFRKAFDSVNWASLLKILRARGFDEHWCRWMELILSTGHTAILLNGVPGDWIRCRNGLRQGDPLSPYLFIIVADVLQRLIRSVWEAGSLSHPLSPDTPCGDFGDPSSSPSFLGRIVAECLPLYRAITGVAVVSGRTTSFWFDRWLPGEPLATRFPALFSHSTRRHASVALVVSQGLSLQDRLTRVAEAELLDVLRLIDTTALQEGEDRRFIDSPSTLRFSSREAYRALSPARPLDTTRANLFRKGCAPSSECAACGATETGRHLFFDCPGAAELWARLDVPIPVSRFSVWDLPDPTQSGPPCTWQFGLATILWSIWKSRNDLVFNGVAHSPASTLQRACDDLSLWRWRLRPADLEPLDRLRSHLLMRVVT